VIRMRQGLNSRLDPPDAAQRRGRPEGLRSSAAVRPQTTRMLVHTLPCRPAAPCVAAGQRAARRCASRSQAHAKEGLHEPAARASRRGGRAGRERARACSRSAAGRQASSAGQAASRARRSRTPRRWCPSGRRAPPGPPRLVRRAAVGQGGSAAGGAAAAGHLTRSVARPPGFPDCAPVFERESCRLCCSWKSVQAGADAE